MRGFDPALEAEPFTLLIADANPEIIAAVRAAVPRHWRCLAAVNARMAWHVLDEVAAPDLALIGVSLPDSDGFQLVARFPENPALTGVPVILVASGTQAEGNDNADSRTAAWRRKAFAMSADFLVWPCDTAELRMRIGSPLANRMLQRHLATADQRLAEQVRIQGEQSTAAQAAALAMLARLSIPAPGQTDQSRIERLTGLCRLLATRMAGITAFRADITPAYLDALCQAVPLHDIGWLACPGVHGRPGGHRLAEDKHAANGARILEDLRQAHPNSQFLALACEMAGSHHENWDGSGQPNGLAGAAIPLSARILSLAVAYDGMRSGCCGQPPVAHAQTIGQLAKNARQRFDPRILDCFLFYEQDFETFSAEYHLGRPPERMDHPAAANEKKAHGPSRDQMPGEDAVAEAGMAHADGSGRPAANAHASGVAHPAGMAYGAGAMPAVLPVIRQGAAS